MEIISYLPYKSSTILFVIFFTVFFNIKLNIINKQSADLQTKVLCLCFCVEFMFKNIRIVHLTMFQ
jgi:hypothetical protein